MFKFSISFHSTTTDNNNTRKKKKGCIYVYIVPATKNKTSPPPPPPPIEAPPKPTKLCRILVLGDRFVGKSSLVQLYVHQAYCSFPSSCGNDAHSQKQEGHDSNTKPKRQDEATQNIHITNMEYTKKDVSLYHSFETQNETSDDEQVCVRVQIWDITSSSLSSFVQHKKNRMQSENVQNEQQQQYDADEEDGIFVDAVQDDDCHNDMFATNVNSNTTAPTTIDAATTATTTKFDELFEKTSGILLVCTLFPSSIIEDDNMTTSAITAQGIYQHVECTIKKWMNFLQETRTRITQSQQHNYNNRGKKQPNTNTNDDDDSNRDEKECIIPPVTLLFSKSDLFYNRHHFQMSSPLDYIHLGSNIQSLCQKWNIRDWYFGSCCFPPSSMVPLLTSLSLSPSLNRFISNVSLQQQWCKDIMSCNDAFTSIVKRYLTSVDSSGGKEGNGQSMKNCGKNGNNIIDDNNFVSQQQVKTIRATQQEGIASIAIQNSPCSSHYTELSSSTKILSTAARVPAQSSTALPLSITTPIVEAHAVSIQDMDY